jgi:uncharacterized repeat protein (TIGR01451 family)
VATVDIRVSKTAPMPTLRRGQVTPGAFVIRVQNTGPGDATNVKVYDVAPSGVQIVGWIAANVQNAAASAPNSPMVGTFLGTGGLITTIPSLPAGSHVDYTLDAQAATTATLGTYAGGAMPQNMAYAIPGIGDSLPLGSTANIGRATFEVRAVQVSAELVKTFSNSNPQQGEEIIMNLVVRNTGAVAIGGGGLITDALPAHLLQLGWTATYTNTTGVVAGSSLPITVPALPVGGEAAYAVRVKVARCAPLDQVANVAQLCLPVGYVSAVNDKPCIASAPVSNGTPGDPTVLTPQKHICGTRLPLGGAGTPLCAGNKIAGSVTVELVNPAGGVLYLDCDPDSCGLDAPRIVTCGVYTTAMFDDNGCWRTCPLPRTTDFLTSPDMCTDAGTPEPYYRVTINQSEINSAGQTVGSGSCAVYELTLPGTVSVPVVPVVTYGKLKK